MRRVREGSRPSRERRCLWTAGDGQCGWGDAGHDDEVDGQLMTAKGEREGDGSLTIWAKGSRGLDQGVSYCRSITMKATVVRGHRASPCPVQDFEDLCGGGGLAELRKDPLDAVVVRGGVPVGHGVGGEDDVVAVLVG
jgi:hypothetical protein